jgi:hypothetical protein
MKRITKVLVTALFFFYISSSCYAQQNRNVSGPPPQSSPSQPQPQQRTQQSPRPILPLAIPNSAPVPRPTASPNISSPPVAGGTINNATGPAIFEPGIQVQMIGNFFGIVEKVETRKDGTFVVKLKDTLFDSGVFDIVIPDNITITKGISNNKPIIINRSAIKTGDTLTVAFVQRENIFIATSVSVFTEEALKMMKEALEKKKAKKGAAVSEEIESDTLKVSIPPATGKTEAKPIIDNEEGKKKKKKGFFGRFFGSK